MSRLCFLTAFLPLSQNSKSLESSYQKNFTVIPGFLGHLLDFNLEFFFNSHFHLNVIFIFPMKWNMVRILTFQVT